MPMLQNAAVLAALAYRAAAHGTVQGFVGGGLWYQGYSPSFQYQNPEPVVVGWSSPEDQDNGFVAPSAYADADIICHKGATNAQTQATVAAGSKVEFQWTVWPESHHGPVITYMANCNGACETVDKTTLEFFKIDEGGLVDDSTAPGTWASDQLIANNNSWVTVIPSDIAAGNYVLRHEIIALHSAGNADGAQNYPQCINVKVTGGGSATPSGTLGTALYKSDDPGILVNIYTTLSSYTIPGPTLYSGATTAAQTTIPFSGAASVTSGAVSGASSVVATSAVATSAVATSAVASSIPPTSTPVASSVQIVAETSAPAISTPTSAPYTASYAPVESFTPSSVSAAPIVSQIAGLTTALPSGVLTSVLPTTPSGTGAASPDATLPDGFTVKDLLEWMMWILENFLSDEGQRQHVRDFHANKRQFGGEQQSGGFAAPSGGFGQGGFPGFGGAAPTGAFPSGFALPTGFSLPSGFSLPTNFPSGAFSGFGGAAPTGFPSDGFGESGAPAAPTPSA